MVNVFLKDSNSYFLMGMSNLLSNLFINEYGLSINFENNPTYQNIKKCDIIVLSLIKGEEYVCNSILKGRCKGILIGLVGSNMPYHNNLPLCHKDMVMLPRQSSKDKIYSTFKHAWDLKSKNTSLQGEGLCINCNFEKLTKRECLIVKELRTGASIASIAKNLSISEKTVYSHKYLIMKKYHIDKTKDLISILRLIDI